MKKNYILLASVFAAISVSATTITMTASDAWNVYKEGTKTPIRSFVDGEHWSDGLPPHADADYLVNVEQYAVNIHANEKKGGQTFGGKSLTIGTNNKIYFHWNMQNPDSCWDYPVTISNLVFNGIQTYIYGENTTYTTNRYVLRGKLTINGTESSWPQHLENSRGDGSWMYIESKLVGAANSFLAVRTQNKLSIAGNYYAIPDPDDTTKPSETAMTGADFNGDLSEYRGTLLAGTNSAIRVGNDFPGCIRLGGKWSAVGSSGSSGTTVNVARVRFNLNGILLASDRYGTLAVTNSFVMNGPIKVRPFEAENLAYISKIDVLNVPTDVATLTDADFEFDSANPDLELSLSTKNGVQTLSIINSVVHKFEPYKEISANADTYAAKNDYISRLRQYFIDNYQPQIAAQFTVPSADAVDSAGKYRTADIHNVTNDFPIWSDGLAPHPGADYVIYPEIWAPRVYTRSLPLTRGTHVFRGDSLTIPDHVYLHFNDDASDVTINNLHLLDGGAIQMYSNGGSQKCVLRGSIEIVAGAGNPAKIRLTGANRELEIAADITGDENSVIMISANTASSFVRFTGDLSGFRGRIIYPYEGNPSFVQLQGSDPTSQPTMANRSQLSYLYSGSWEDGQWPHAGTNYCVGAGKSITLLKSSSIASTNCVERGINYDNYWKKIRFFGDVLAVAGTVFITGESSLDGYAFKIYDLRLVGGAKIAFPDNYNYDSYLDCHADGSTKLRIESTDRNPVVIEGTRRADRTLYIGMSLLGDKNAAIRIVNQNPTSGGRSTVRFNGDVSEYAGTITVSSNMNLVIDRPFNGRVVIEGNGSASYIEPVVDAKYDDVTEIEVDNSVSLADALADIRTRRTGGEFAAGKPVAIVLKPGDYVLDSTLNITSLDSGTKDTPFIIRAEEPGTARIVGSVPFDSSAFSALSGNDPWYHVFPAEAIGKIRVIDVSGLIDDGMKPWNNVDQITGAPWFFADGHFQDISRYPNRLDDEQYYGMTITNCTNTGDSNGGAVLQVNDLRANNWDFSRGDIYVHGYYHYLWDEDYIKVANWSPGTGSVTLGGKPVYPPVLGKPGKVLPLYFYNMPEELDRAEEWWLDRVTKKLYYIPRQDATEFALTTSDRPLVNIARGVHDVRFEGITFAYAYQAFYSGTDLKRITFADCNFRSLVSTSALQGEKCHITRCDFRYLGTGGVRMTGGDRNNLKRGDNVVDFCSFYDFERIKQCNGPGVDIQGCGNAVRNCSFREAGHQGVFYKGNEEFVGWSVFDKVVKLNQDCGAIYTGRDPAGLGCAVVGCSFSNMAGDDRNAVYYDDCNWGDATYGNVFRNIYRALHIGGGNLHRTKWNAFYDCSLALHLDSRGYTRTDFVTSDQWWAEAAAKFPSGEFPWTAAYPGYLAAIADNPPEPKNNIFESLYLAHCTKWTTIALKPQQQVGGYPTYSNGVTMASIVTVSTNGTAGTGFPGWTHYNWNAGTDKVSGLDAALARIAAHSNNYSRVRCFPGFTGDVTVEIGVSANERLSLSAKFRGREFIEDEPLYGAISYYKDYARYVKPEPPTISSAGGVQTLRMPITDYIDNDKSAVLEVSVDSNGEIAYRFVSTNGVSLVDWRTFNIPAADIRNGVLYVDVASGTERQLNAAEIAALVDNTVSGVVKTGRGVLCLNQPLTGYNGYWTKNEGAIRVMTSIDPFGSAGDAVITVNNDTGYTNYLGDLEVVSSCVIERPVNFVGANTRLFTVAENVTVRFTKMITMSGDTPRSYFYADSTCIVEGGLTSSILFTCTGPGTVVFDGKPITMYSSIWFEVNNNIVFNSVSNHVGGILCSNTSPGATITLNDPIALKPNTCQLANYGNGPVWVNDYSQFKYFQVAGSTKPVPGYAYFESDDLSLSAPRYCTFHKSVTNLVNFAPADVELFHGSSSLTVSDAFISAMTAEMPDGFTAWREGNSIFAHIGIVPGDGWIVLDGGANTNFIFTGMLVKDGTLNLGSDWKAKTVTGTLAFDSFAYGYPEDSIYIKTRMTSQYLEGPLVAGRFEKVHFADFRDTSAPRLPVTEKRTYNGIVDYYLLNTAFWYSYYLRGDCSDFEATSVAEWGAVIYLDRQDGVFPGNFELGNFSVLGARKTGMTVRGDVTGSDAWLRVTTGSSLTIEGKVDFGWAEDASRAGIYGKDHSVRVYTNDSLYHVNTISVQSQANLTTNEAVLDGTLILFEGGQSSVTIRKLTGTPEFEVPDGYRLITSQTENGTRYSVVYDPMTGSQLIFR